MFKSLSVSQNHRYFFTLSWYNASATECRAATSPGHDSAPEKPVNLPSQKEKRSTSDGIRKQWRRVEVSDGEWGETRNVQWKTGRLYTIHSLKVAEKNFEFRLCLSPCSSVPFAVLSACFRASKNAV